MQSSATRPSLEGTRRASSRTNFTSSSFRKHVDDSTREKRSGLRRGGLHSIQAGLNRVSTEDVMPQTSREMWARERRREEEYDERKAIRKERLKAITNRWSDNRMENSDLQRPHRASWVRSGSLSDADGNKCGSFLCCFG